jgi:hypothetical protein
MREEARARLAVLLAAMLPMLIWPLGKGQLLHPWPVAVGALFCAGLAATAPGQASAPRWPASSHSPPGPTGK